MHFNPLKITENQGVLYTMRLKINMAISIRNHVIFISDAIDF